MQLRPFGRTGIRVPSLCLGVMNFGDPTDAGESEKILLSALDAGLFFVDTADVYAGGESERIVGDVLARAGRRDEVVLATKVGVPTGGGPNDRGASRRHITRSVEGSLRRLQTDRIDLYQLHRPWFDIAPEETMAAFDTLVRAGKVLHVGCSTHPAWWVRECLAASDRFGWARYVSEQPPYNILDRRIEDELVPLAQRHGLAIIPWSPLGGGVLAGRYASATEFPEGSRADRRPMVRDRISARSIEVATEVAALARDRALTAGQLALLWVRDQPGITSPIIGPRTIDQLTESLAVADHTGLDQDALERIDELVPPGTAVADFFNNSGWTAGRWRKG